MAAQKNKFALGALIGMAAGVVAGLLTAPKSGKQTRSDIRKKAEELKSEATVKGEELSRDAKARKAQVEEKASELSREAKARGSDLKSRVEGAVEGAREGFNKKDSSEEK